VRLAEDARRSVDIMKRLPVRADEGGLLTLGQGARFEMIEQVGAVTRESGQRRTAILVNLRGRDVEGIVNEAQKRIKAEVKFPSGESEENRAKRDLYIESILDFVPEDASRLKASIESPREIPE
jgi:cobalt-zinc-cadmium resistance protein CzcA